MSQVVDLTGKLNRDAISRLANSDFLSEFRRFDCDFEWCCVAVTVTANLCNPPTSDNTGYTKT